MQIGNFKKYNSRFRKQKTKRIVKLQGLGK